MDDSMTALDSIRMRAGLAQNRYGDFASTHEALGVLIEEFQELQSAIHGNNIDAVRQEAFDLAAVAFRLAKACGSESGAFFERSVK